jgi:hypothetical protein
VGDSERKGVIGDREEKGRAERGRKGDNMKE